MARRQIERQKIKNTVRSRSRFEMGQYNDDDDDDGRAEKGWRRRKKGDGGRLGSTPSTTIGALGPLSKDFSEQRVFSVLVDVMDSDVSVYAAKQKHLPEAREAQAESDEQASTLRAGSTKNKEP
ncbi:hypothetical protein MGYG_06010 [Nannizzia gypsea CBS 118893]|uniref:Uncharacterized protein n=1 Tax=Arthroderma gypseum (strain ATCC MYA-4604 / CBS 118893) TaxID=535722 RepID=E4V072_ARTGP|nr:hypothetical protein MGYG_06010 [Nannizzia gypsea CBS 118893]EFR03009.1 hypothetical protein MGYG_06010 [Nannizzia gypsea CBS 118893]